VHRDGADQESRSKASTFQVLDPSELVPVLRALSGRLARAADPPASACARSARPLCPGARRFCWLGYCPLVSMAARNGADGRLTGGTWRNHEDARPSTGPRWGPGAGRPHRHRFHEGASGLSGGFLGVDIFFVLSGFLITDLLVSGYDRTGRMDLTGFWVRRARRLLPALAIMLVVVTAAATVIESGQETSLRLALLAASTYTSNWYQILHHVSYFAAAGQAGAPPPLDHLWSLAIEEQFYLVWPLIVWCLIVRLTARRARVTCALIGAAISALAMALQYTPGGDPSGVYYSTDTRASALLIGAALALAWPLRTLAAIPAVHNRRLDIGGVIGLAALAWAAGHFSGGDPVVYPVGLLLAALAAAALVAAAAANGLIAAITSWRPLRWVGVRSYGIYLWHWPVIALSAALVGSAASSPWLWLAETGVTIAVAAASWRFIEMPIMRDGLRATIRRWVRLVAETSRRPAAGTRGRALPVAVAAAVAITFVVACYGVIRTPAPDAPRGLLRQVANGERVTSSSQATPSASPAPSPSPARSKAASSAPPPLACRHGQPRVSGGQVTAVGDSVMLASAADHLIRKPCRQNVNSGLGTRPSPWRSGHSCAWPRSGPPRQPAATPAHRHPHDARGSRRRYPARYYCEL
jgi:peptidoglycan/LPS O-acetylase OafA/YrhL